MIYKKDGNDLTNDLIITGDSYLNSNNVYMFYNDGPFFIHCRAFIMLLFMKPFSGRNYFWLYLPQSCFFFFLFLFPPNLFFGWQPWIFWLLSCLILLLKRLLTCVLLIFTCLPNTQKTLEVLQFLSVFLLRWF